MLFHHASKNRPFHLGTYPLEVLPRDDSLIAVEAARPRAKPAAAPRTDGALAAAVARYRDLFAGFIAGEPVEKQAPVPSDLDRRAVDIKGCAYFMDASQVGICRIPENAWLEGSDPVDGHDHAVVLLIEHPRLPDRDNLARGWTEGGVAAACEMRALEVAACVAGHIRQMGFDARIHIAGDGSLDRERLAVLAGLCVREGGLVNPYVENGFTLAALSTDYAMACDAPLAASAAKAWGEPTGRALTGRSPDGSARAARGADPTTAAIPWSRSGGWTGRPR